MFTSFCCENENFTDDVNSELRALFLKTIDNEVDTYSILDGRLYQKILFLSESKSLFFSARKQWREMERFLFSDATDWQVDVSLVRQQMVDLLSLCRYNLQVTPRGTLCTELKTELVINLTLIKNCVTFWSDQDERFFVKFASVRDEPINQYLHMYLEVQWLLLTLFHLCELPVDDFFQQICNDLIKFSHIIFKSKAPSEILTSNSFLCCCLKKFWLMLFLFNEKLTNEKRFWDAVNESLKNSDDSFSLWLLNDVFNAVNSNNLNSQDYYALINSKLKSLNSKLNPNLDNNQILLSISKLTHSILQQISSIKLEPYQILWEIFNRHLEFLSDPNSAASSVKTMDLVDRIVNNKRIENPYEYFLYMLHDLFSKHPNQWPRMRGRIYCKLPPNKINEVNDSGLHNISLLFFTLTKSLSLTEISQKFLTILSNLTPERRATQLVINIYTSLAVIHVVNDHSVTEICGPLLQIIDEIVQDRNRFHLIRSYVDGFEEILSASQHFGLNQHLFIDKWTFRYIKTCQINDLCYFLDVLTCNVSRIRNSGSWSEWESALKAFVSPNLKNVAVTSNAPVQVGELAALIDLNPSSENMIIFTGDSIAPRVVCQFLTTILDNAPNHNISKNHETAILHAWVRCCLLDCENSEKLTRTVLKINSLHKTFDPNFICGSKPLCAFIQELGKLENLKCRSTNVAELCKQCFGRLDAWVVPYIKNPSSETITMDMFTCVALLFIHCAPLLYNKSRSNCLLNKLISIFLLPTNILIGISPHPYVLKSIQSTWHIFMQGIYSLLSNGSDAYLERMIRDMTVRYLPLLSFEDSPILKAMQNENLRKVILEKLYPSFLSHTSKTTDDNIFKALKLIRLSMENEPSIDKICAILDVTLLGILEVLMFSANKSSAIEIVKFIKGKYRDERLNDCFGRAIAKITEKHLAFYANSFFQFTSVLVQVVPTEVRCSLPLIKKQVMEVEKMRGVGYDNTLRHGLERLEKLLS